MTSLDGKTKYAEKAIIELNKTGEVEREMYLPLVASCSGLNIDFIRRMMKGETENSDDKASQSEKIIPNTSYSREVLPQDSSYLKAEKQVLSSILHKKNYAYPRVNYSYLFTDTRVKYFEFLFQNRDKEASQLVQLFYSTFGEESSEQARQEASEIISYTFSAGDEAHENAYFKDCLFLLYKRYSEVIIKEKTEQLKNEVETDKRRQIMQDIQNLVKNIKSKKVDL